MIRRSCLTIVVLLISSVLSCAEEPIRFNRDIRPIIAEHCYHCHGPDPSSRKAGLRFDREESLFAARGAEVATVVRGKPDESPLYQRISTADLDDIMPPEKAHKPLSPEKIARVRRWIAEGAQWEPHWSLIAPVRPILPAGDAAPIDRFVRQHLAEAGLEPAAEADRRTLIRRVNLDLTGLPPEPEAVATFVADTSPLAYEHLVDGLLASPRYGEHRARYWLDAARYADTHGLHFDNYREMWAYRDWVIASFNADQPFDQFTIEQIAGDLLPQPTRQQVIATGFHRCAMTTNEGGTIEAENLAMYARERVETTSWVWLGLTANCAVCHDHKFDPLPTRDFYAFSAFFRNTTQSSLDGNIKDSAPVAPVPQSPADEARLIALNASLAASHVAITARRETLNSDLNAWLATQDATKLHALINAAGAPAVHLPLTAATSDGVLTGTTAAGQAITTHAVKPVRDWDDAPAGKAPRLHNDDDTTIDGVPDFGRNTPYTFACWVMLPAASSDTGAILSRMDDGDGYRGWDLWVQGDQFAAHLIHRWPDDALKVHTRGGLKRGTWQHVCVAYDGSGSVAGLQIFIDGTAAAVDVEADTLKTTSLTTAPFKLARRKNGGGVATVSLQDLRIYATRLSDEAISRIAGAGQFATVLAKPAAERTAADREVLLNMRVMSDEPLRQARAASARDEAERAAIMRRGAVTHVMQERTDATAVAYVLNRGQYDQPREKVEAGVFTALPAMPTNAPKNRLGLAHWLVAPENPLTARVTVNRLWQEFFGTGLVRTTEDFGIMGDAPSHPELLDWLAAEFRDSGWKVKSLIRTIVCSSTYRQAAVATPAKLEKDPANRLLSRGPHYRMDAEMVRDVALSAAGVLSPMIGGPSVRPYQPEGVWESVGMQESDTHRYQRDHGEALYRRSMYTFWKRQAPPAAMEVFNAPSRETSCVRRDRTNTPLQALVTLNDEQFIEAARLLAARILTLGGDDPQHLDAVAQRVLSRPFTPDEMAVVQGSLTRLRERYRAAPDAVTALLALGETRSADTLNQVELAALTMVCNQVFNLDEALCK